MKTIVKKPILERIELQINRDVLFGVDVYGVVLDVKEWSEFDPENRHGGHAIIELNGVEYSVVKEGYWCV